MHHDARFWDRIATKYAANPISDEAAYERKLALTREYLTPEAEVLELGCGTGTTALAQAPHAGQILATDFAPAMIEIARAKAAEAGVETVTFEVAGLEDIDGTARFDMVMAHNLLHLLPDPWGALPRIAALIKPGGVFVSSTACLADTHNWLRYIAPIGRAIGKIPRVSFFSAEALKAAHSEAGLEILEDWQPGPKAARFLIARKPG